MSALDLSTLKPGFADAVMDAQASFQAAMWALSRPGLPRPLAVTLEAPAGLSPALAALLLALVDFETPLWMPPALANGEAGAYARFHASAPLVEAAQDAVFAVSDATGAAELLGRLRIGEDRYPDRSATLFVDVPSFEGGPPVRLSGPGVNGALTIAPAGLDDGFWQAFAGNHGLYPLGVDCFLCCGNAVIGLPRSTAATLIREM